MYEKTSVRALKVIPLSHMVISLDYAELAAEKKHDFVEIYSKLIKKVIVNEYMSCSVDDGISKVWIVLLFWNFIALLGFPNLSEEKSGV